nr:MAG TPA: hypothetical protein [Caudoviricetes sp.]
MGYGIGHRQDIRHHRQAGLVRHQLSECHTIQQRDADAQG